MKSRIIVFPGKMDSVFFLNEIDYIISQFDNVYIFSYKGAISQYNQIAVEKNIQ